MIAGCHLLVTASSRCHRGFARGHYRTAMTSVREIKIPVPWGHIAGRESGPEDGRPLLMLHGWLDNCGTFERIQQHLPKDYRCINIDVPGHGLSSPLPAGVMYSFFSGVTYIHLVREHFGWQRFSLLGHSMGSGMSMLYAATFPENVDSLILLELVKLFTPPVEKHPDLTRQSVTGYVDTLRKLACSSKPQYTYEALRTRLMAGIGGIDEAAADALLVRGARRDPGTGQYEYTYDLRQRIRSLHPISAEQYLSYCRRLRCRLLVLLADDGGKWIPQEEERQALELYQQTAVEFRLVRVPGQHHVHLTHPERVLPHLQDFLSVHDSADQCTAKV